MPLWFISQLRHKYNVFKQFSFPDTNHNPFISVIIYLYIENSYNNIKEL